MANKNSQMMSTKENSQDTSQEQRKLYPLTGEIIDQGEKIEWEAILRESRRLGLKIPPQYDK